MRAWVLLCLFVRPGAKKPSHDLVWADTLERPKRGLRHNFDCYKTGSRERLKVDWQDQKKRDTREKENVREVEKEGERTDHAEMICIAAEMK